MRLARMGEPPILCAGAVVTRPGREVLVVHRPKYDDWSLPKGKLDPGEHEAAAAVREVREEAGVRVRLGIRLSGTSYDVGGRTKVVHWWSARVVGDDDVSSYTYGEEIDEVRWVSLDKGRQMLDHPRDRYLLDEAFDRPRKTAPLVVLRHTEAIKRAAWSGDEQDRPLTPAGERHAEALVPVLAAFTGHTKPPRLVSSSSRRCVDTVRPWARQTGVRIRQIPSLTEEHATPDEVHELMGRLLDSRRPAVVCGHRPVLPWMLDGLGVERTSLEVGQMVIVHHKRGRVVAADLL